MLNKRIIRKALNQILSMDNCIRSQTNMASDILSCVTSRLVYDSFGGEILKTHFKKGWHFYNRINGKNLDFTVPESAKSSRHFPFDDIPSDPDETYNYIQEEDYRTQFIRFIRAFEETWGLKRSST